MVKMVVHNGVQYRPEDAERLGIKSDETVEQTDSSARVIRAGDVENKARFTATTDAKPPTAAERKAADKAAKDAADAQAAASGGGTA